MKIFHFVKKNILQQMNNILEQPLQMAHLNISVVLSFTMNLTAQINSANSFKIMDSQSHSNFFISAWYWIIGQVSYIFSILFAYSSLEYIFKLLSVISVFMVLVINFGNFVKQIKIGWRKIKSLF